MKPALATDAQYLAAVKAGSVEWMQQMVDAAAKAAGYTIGPVYHASKNKFDVFLSKADQAEQRGEEFEGEDDDVGNLGKGFYFTPDKTYASKYGTVRSFYLKIKNIVNLDDSRTRNRALDIETELEEELGQVFPSDVYEALMDEQKSDGIIGKGVGGFSAGATELMVKKSNQIKLADPVTYDKQGNVIPLSQRFDSGREEITNPAGRIPAQFPYEYASYLKQHFPEIWKLGGNIRGNDAFRWWTAYRQGDRSPTVMHWWTVTRPAWIARHYRDHLIAGVVAQIKWGTIGRLGVEGMKRVVETKIRNSR